MHRYDVVCLFQLLCFFYFFCFFLWRCICCSSLFHVCIILSAFSRVLDQNVKDFFHDILILLEKLRRIIKNIRNSTALNSLHRTFILTFKPQIAQLKHLIYEIPLIVPKKFSKWNSFKSTTKDKKLNHFSIEKMQSKDTTNSWDSQQPSFQQS